MLLSMAILLNGLEDDISDKIMEIYDNYDSTVPDPCYFCNIMPRITFREMYSALVGTNSIPMEYVNQRPDFYIKQWPSKTKFLNDHPHTPSHDLSDLPDLYKSANEFFNENSPGDDGVLGGDYCTLSSDEACYKLGWPPCCLDKSLIPCPIEQPPCNVDPPTMTPIVNEDCSSVGKDNNSLHICRVIENISLSLSHTHLCFVLLHHFCFQGDIVCTDPRFSELCDLLKKANLAEELSTGLWTLFAPQNGGFNDVVPGGGLEDLNSVQLKNFLMFHLVGGVELTKGDLKCLSPVNLVGMANGKDSRTLCDNGKPTYQRGSGNDKSDSPVIDVMDTNACNGVIHTITKALLFETYG
jgi:uncharacterized surface protein with fasciclin (FAS1) repeats